MTKTGFLLVDGNEALGRAPAAPRHWGEALLIVIVAQWIYWQGDALGRVIAWIAVQDGMLRAMHGGVSVQPLALLLFLFAPSLIVAGLAFYLSQRLDRRSPKALGVDLMTAPTALVWVFAGLVAAVPSAVAVATSGADMGDVAQGAAILTPVTIVQAGAEELLFRGVILASIAARYGVRTGLLVSAFLFGLWHVQVGQSLLDAGVSFAAAFVFGLTGGVLTLHYANLGPAIALHVVWNVAIYLNNGTSQPELDFWWGWASTFQQPWTFDQVQSGALLKFLAAPLMIETLIVLAACRETVQRVFTGRRAAAPA